MKPRETPPDQTGRQAKAFIAEQDAAKLAPVVEPAIESVKADSSELSPELIARVAAAARLAEHQLVVADLILRKRYMIPNSVQGGALLNTLMLAISANMKEL
jgi:hypothetical protein